MTRKKQQMHDIPSANQLAGTGSLGYALFCTPMRAIELDGDDV
jgi:hypothetical protein